VISESGDGEWAPMSLDGIAEALRRAYELLVSDDVVIRSVGELKNQLKLPVKSSPRVGPSSNGSEVLWEYLNKRIPTRMTKRTISE